MVQYSSTVLYTTDTYPKVVCMLHTDVQYAYAMLTHDDTGVCHSSTTKTMTRSSVTETTRTVTALGHQPSIWL